MYKRVICYGDSNTYGYDAADFLGGRLPPEQQWPVILSGKLGCETVNCGMNGRTVPRSERAREADLRLIQRSEPFDLLLVMLGTNDLLLGREPDETAEQMDTFLSSVRQRVPKTEILLLAPPAALGMESLFQELASEYAILANKHQYAFLDLTQSTIPLAADDVHFSPEGHQRAAEIIVQAVTREYEKTLEV